MYRNAGKEMPAKAKSVTKYIIPFQPSITFVLTQYCIGKRDQEVPETLLHKQIYTVNR